MDSTNLPVAIPISTNDDNNTKGCYSGIVIPNLHSYSIPIINQNPINPDHPQNINLPIQPHFRTQFVGTEDMALTWRLSKTIRFFSIIDIFFCLLYLFINPLFGVLLIFPLLGYQGANQYSICKTYAYFFFVTLNLTLRVYSYTIINTFGGLLLCILSITVDVWILRILYYFTKNIKNLQSHELLQIREPDWEPLQTSLVWS